MTKVAALVTWDFADLKDLFSQQPDTGFAEALATAAAALSCELSPAIFISNAYWDSVTSMLTKSYCESHRDKWRMDREDYFY